MITFRFAADPTESIALSYSPVLEAVLSLHVLTGPKHHPLQHAWVRKARDFAPELRRDIAAFGFAYRGFVPEFLVPSPEIGYRTFDEELHDLERFDQETIALGFLRPLWDHRGERDEALLESELVRGHVIARAEHYEADPELADLIFD